MNKSIFITGGANGIGRSVAALFANNGWKVGIMDIDAKGLEEVKAQHADLPIHTYQGDVTDQGSVSSALRQYCPDGKLDVLLNNAGVLQLGGLENCSLKSHKRVIDINLLGIINVAQIALPYLKKAPNSHLINMSSASSLYGHPEITTYAATKSAVRSLTEGWNLIYKKHGVHVSDIAPLYVDTNMVSEARKALPDESGEVEITPEDVAQVVWTSAHSNKLHYYVGGEIGFMRFAKRILPTSVFHSLMRKSKHFKGGIQRN